MAVLEATSLSCGYNGVPVVSDVAVTLESGRAITVVGPNGSGKSTLLRTLSGALPMLSGEVRVDGVSVSALDGKERAKRLSVLLQSQPLDSGLTVRDLVGLGRTPYLGRFGNMSRADDRVVEESIALCDLTPLAARSLGTISGGERQRTRLAMVLAQSTNLVLLDEPTNHLDVGHRYMLFRILENIRVQKGISIVMVSHSLEDARRFGDATLLVDGGRATLFERDNFDELRQRMVRSSGIPADWVY